jgi:thiol:disulfide interchange protein DsbC
LKAFSRSVLAFVATLALTLPALSFAQSPQEKIRASLEPKLNNGAKIIAITPSPVAGLYEVRVGQELMYADETGTHLFQGNLINLVQGRDLTRERNDQYRAETERTMMPTLWSAASLADAVKLVKGNGKHKVIVFEDPYCGYCKKLRQSFEAMNDITVYTFMTANLSADSPKKARELWCASERVKAYDDWMVRGKAPAAAAASCADPVAKVAELARKMGVGPVPAIYFADGSAGRGYMAAPELEARLAQVKAMF